MNSEQRAATTRILVDLIKADRVIDSREMSMYAELKEKFAIQRDDEIRANSMTLAQAVNTLRGMDRESLDQTIDTFKGMTISDGFCAHEEALLLTGLLYTLEYDTSFEENDIISAVIDSGWFDSTQVLYVESRYNPKVNSVIASNLRVIKTELKLCGFDFVYIPEVAHHYVTAPNTLLHEVMSFISPNLGDNAIRELLNKIKLFKTDTFCIEQLHHKLGLTEMIDTDPALLCRIGQSKAGEQTYTNFLRIGLGENALETIRTFADRLMKLHSSDFMLISRRLDADGRFLYKGFYRQLFELLLLQRSVMCHLTIDIVHQKLTFLEIEADLKQLHRKEKALYTLFVFEAREGNGGISFTPPDNPRALDRFNRRMALLQRRYALIYEAFGGDSDNVPDITSSKIRLPMLAGIKRAINSLADRVYESQRFCIARDHNGLYSLTARPELFLVNDFTNPTPIQATDSTLFATLATIK